MEQLYRALEKLNIQPEKNILSKFERYMRLVLEWNEKVNLTAITEENEFITKHFIDSLLCSGLDEFKISENIIDVGTGAGFPGVPLAMAFPDKRFLLIDSTGKKIKILGEILAELEILNVSLLHARAEELSRKKEYREKFDLCVTRAVADLTALSGYCMPFLAVGGSLIAYKGPDIQKELKQAEPAIKDHGGKIKEVRKADPFGFGLDHTLVIIEKKRKTVTSFS